MHARSWAELPKRPSPASYAETAEAISAESLSAQRTASGTSGRGSLNSWRPSPFEHLNDSRVSPASLPGARKAHPETEGSDALQSNRLPGSHIIVDMQVETRCPLTARYVAPRAQPESGLGQSVPQSRSSCAAIVLAALEIVSDYPFAISPTTSEFERAMIAAFSRAPQVTELGHQRAQPTCHFAFPECV